MRTSTALSSPTALQERLEEQSGNAWFPLHGFLDAAANFRKLTSADHVAPNHRMRVVRPTGISVIGGRCIVHTLAVSGGGRFPAAIGREPPACKRSADLLRSGSGRPADRRLDMHVGPGIGEVARPSGGDVQFREISSVDNRDNVPWSRSALPRRSPCHERNRVRSGPRRRSRYFRNWGFSQVLPCFAGGGNGRSGTAPRVRPRCGQRHPIQ